MSTDTPRRRRRPARSCVECRRRKIKCNRNDPCAHCSASKATCVYTPYIHSGLNPEPQSSIQSPPASMPLTQSRHFVSPRSFVSPNINLSPGQNPTPRTVPSTVNSPQSFPCRQTHGYPSDNVQGLEATVRDLTRRIQSLENGRELRGTGLANQSQDDQGDGASPVSREIGSERMHLLSRVSKMHNSGWNHLISSFDDFSVILELFRKSFVDARQAPCTTTQDQSNILLDIATTYQRCKSVARMIKISRPTRSKMQLDELPPLTSRELADAMAKAYWDNFESAHRILHGPTFWGVYMRYWENPSDVSTAERFLVLLVVGIGAMIGEREARNEWEKNVMEWVYAAQIWLSGPLEKDRVSIHGIQVACLVILSRQIISLGPDLIWPSVGSLVHSAMLMGLHRDPVNLRAMKPLEAEIRRRLWATILDFMMQASVDSELPPSLSFTQFDTEPPANLDDEDMDDTAEAVTPHPSDVFTSASAQIALFSSLKTRYRICEIINSVSLESSYVDVLTLSEDLTILCRRASALMTRPEFHPGITAFRHNFLDYLIRRPLMHLHFPFAIRARTNPLFHFSRQTALDTAVTIMSPEPDPTYKRLMAVGGGMFRHGCRMAGSILAMELIAMTREQAANHALGRVPGYRRALNKTLESVTEQAKERVQNGETNIKMFVFLEMVRAQIKAIEEGNENGGQCEDVIASRARAALQTALAILEDRLDDGASMDWLDEEATFEEFDIGGFFQEFI